MASDALIPAVIAFSILSCIWLLSTLYMSLQFYCKCNLYKSTIAYTEQQSDFSHSIRNSTMSYLIVYSIAYIVILTLSTLALSDIELFYSHNIGYKISIVTIIICSCIGYFSFYLYAISRLYHLFSITKCLVIKYIFLNSLVTILLSTYAASYYLFKQQLLIKKNLMVMIVAITGVVINLYIAVSLVYIFIKRLSNMERSVIQNDNESLSNKRMRIKLINITIKHCLLNSMALIIFNIIIP
eukprot:200252_1